MTRILRRRNEVGQAIANPAQVVRIQRNEQPSAQEAYDGDRSRRPKESRETLVLSSMRDSVVARASIGRPGAIDALTGWKGLTTTKKRS